MLMGRRGSGVTWKRHNDESVVVGSGGSRGDKGVLCNGGGDIPESLGEKDNTKGRYH